MSALAFDFGAAGVSEVLGFEQPEGEETVHTRVAEECTLEVYFETPPPEIFREELRRLCPASDYTVSQERNQDWLAEWKKGFKPFPLTGAHWVVPSWCEVPSDVTHPIWMDPGMAFGTGTHETTQLCAEALQRVLGDRRVGSLLDVGTGTGILAILARHLGVPEVAATEIEEDSRRVARENFALNKVVDIEMSERQIEGLEKNFDVVVANIIDGVLVRVQEALQARVKKGGRLIVSGIILEREKDFLTGFRLPPNTTWARRSQKGDWLCYEVDL